MPVKMYPFQRVLCIRRHFRSLPRLEVEGGTGHEDLLNACVGAPCPGLVPWTLEDMFSGLLVLSAQHT